jgi:ABC-2 type transport system permease protein
MLISKLALFTRFEQLVSGIFDLTAIVYFVSVIVFFLFLSAGVMEKKRQG